MKEKLVEEIVSLEWEMFAAVNNVGGASPCQNDHKTFDIMRSSQAEAWTEELLESYIDDLKVAREHNRNLMTEKYAYMMERTFPGEYAKIEAFLPVVDESTMNIIDKIVEVSIDLRLDTFEKYPNLLYLSRAIRSSEDTAFQTSFETYLRGELKTYSLVTLVLYLKMLQGYLETDTNFDEVCMLNMVKKYGYDTLEQANAATA